jgi:serine phosphatase RsbU (regulator of sigma subunit)
MAHVTVRKAGENDRIVQLRRAETLIGRGHQCQVQLENDNRVSKEHAAIIRDQSGYSIENRSKKNYTELNARIITDLMPLRQGDRITIFDFLLLFEDDPEPPPPCPRYRIVASWRDCAAAPEAFGEALVKTTVEFARAVCQLSLRRADLLEQIGPLLSGVFPAAKTIGVMLRMADPKRQLRLEACHPAEGRAEELDPDPCVAHDCVQNRSGALCVALAEPADQGPIPAHASAMAAPLAGDVGVFGVVWVAAPTRCLALPDLQLLCWLANLIATALENAQSHQTAISNALLAGDNKIARRIQMEFLPRVVPQVNGYEFFKLYKPALSIGGDYFDFIWLPDRRLAVLVADVAGKGVPAALLMSRFSAEARYCLTLNAHDPARAVQRLNAAMSEVVGERFVTLVACILTPSSHRVEVVCCGHEPPWLLRAGSAKFDYTVDSERVGNPVGVLADSNYVSVHVKLDLGDNLLLFTDGITDARDSDDRVFGVDRLHGIPARVQASNRPGLSAKALGQLVINEVMDHVAEHPQADDITVVCFGRAAEDGGSDLTTDEMGPAH